MAVLARITVLTAPVKRGKPIDDVFLRILSFYLSGSGITIRLLCPLASTDRTPKTTLSLDSGRSTLVSVVRVVFSSEKLESVVLRHKTSYALAPAAAPHCILESFSSSLVTR